MIKTARIYPHVKSIILSINNGYQSAICSARRFRATFNQLTGVSLTIKAKMNGLKKLPLSLKTLKPGQTMKERNVYRRKNQN